LRRARGAWIRSPKQRGPRAAREVAERNRQPEPKASTRAEAATRHDIDRYQRGASRTSGPRCGPTGYIALGAAQIPQPNVFSSPAHWSSQALVQQKGSPPK
jgi:hypothetical protein